MSEGAVPAKLPIRGTLVDVARLYRAHWRLLIPLALVVLIPQAIADAAVGDYKVEHLDSLADVKRLATIPFTVAINLGGEALYSGIIASVVLSWRAGTGEPDLRGVARSIPYLTLIAIDLTIAAGTAIGLILLVVPGIMFATYTFIAPALVEVRHLGLRAAVREAFELVRGSFWRVLAIAAIAYEGTEVIVGLLVLPFHGVQYEAAAHLIIEGVIEPFQGVAAVLTALALLEIHGRKPVEPGARRT